MNNRGVLCKFHKSILNVRDLANTLFVQLLLIVIYIYFFQFLFKFVY